MTWHLKDRELEKKLIEIAPDFVESLNESLKLGEYEENSWTYKVWFGPYEDCYKFEMHVYDDELEEVPEYNPKAWNDYPKVKPVEPGIYRLEVKRNAGGVTRCYAAVFDFSTGKNWYIYGQGNLIDTDVLDGGYVRFRPWED